MSTIADLQNRTPRLSRDGSVRLASAGPSLWRAVDANGRIIGHIEAIAHPHGVRYRARRFHAASRSFRDLGDFWSADDAVDCLRYAR